MYISVIKVIMDSKLMEGNQVSRELYEQVHKEI